VYRLVRRRRFLLDLIRFRNIRVVVFFGIWRFFGRAGDGAGASTLTSALAS